MKEAEDTTEQQKQERSLAIRKEAVAKIDPGTAEVICEYACVVEHDILPFDADIGHGMTFADYSAQIGRELFARAPGTDIWVHLADLLEATARAIEERWAEDCRRQIAEVQDFEVPF